MGALYTQETTVNTLESKYGFDTTVALLGSIVGEGDVGAREGTNEGMLLGFRVGIVDG